MFGASPSQPENVLQTIGELIEVSKFDTLYRDLVDLPQSDQCEIIYYQVGDEWRKFPPAAPTLKKRIRLSIDPADENITNIWHEASFGSRFGGGGGINWERAG
jgi:hypothetical protein